ncbi:hypothetical protein HY640_01315 [Candidatus Woesearchaeota archaeon]|nr:hypothetical protein [Candidatus Woesearchaeota archaeon]
MLINEILSIPAIDTNYYLEMCKLRGGVSGLFQVQDRYPDIDSLQKAIKFIAPDERQVHLAGMRREAVPRLEQMLFVTTLCQGIPLWMGNPRTSEGESEGEIFVQYSLRTEGMTNKKNGKRRYPNHTGLAARRTLIHAALPLYELQGNWEELLVTDRMLHSDPELRAGYLPSGADMLLSTVHEFRQVDRHGKVTLPARRYDARIKSGLETAFKHTDWLTGLKEAVEDYCASRSVCPETEFVERVTRFLVGYNNPISSWNGLLLAQNCEAELERLVSGLPRKNGTRSEYSSKISPYIVVERNSDGRAARFIEARLPHLGSGIGNQVNHHFETEGWYNEREGDHGLNHLNYSAERFRTRITSWTSLHWAVFKGIAVPIFAPEHIKEFAHAISESALDDARKRQRGAVTANYLK